MRKLGDGSTEEEIQEYINLIDDMLLNEKYEFANDFLVSVVGFAKHRGYLTEKQKQGVQNIFSGGDKQC